MFRRNLLTSLFIFASLISVCQIPFKGNLSSNAQKNFGKAQLLRKTSLEKSHKLFRTIYASHLNDNGDVALWSLLNYCNSLLEVDSLQKAFELLNSEQTKNRQNVAPWLVSYEDIIEAEVRIRQGESLELLASSSVFNDSVSSSFLKLELLKLQAFAFLLKGQFYSSRLKWLEAISVSEHVQDSVQIADCRLQLTKACLYDSRLNESRAELSLAKSFYGLGNLPKQIEFLNLESHFALLNNNIRKAEKLSLEAYEMSSKPGSLKLRSQSLFQLAKSYTKSSNWNQALRHFNSSLQLATQASELYLVPELLNEISLCYFRLEELNNAIEYAQSARVKSRSLGQVHQEITALKILAEISNAQSNYKSAFSFLTAAERLRDSLIIVEGLNTSEELELKFKTSRAEQELLLLQKEQTIITNRWITLALGMFLTIIIGILIYDNQKRKYRQQTELLKADEELRKAEIKIMTEVLEKNQQKLTDYTDNLLKKTELVEKLEHQVKSTVSESGDNTETNKILDNISNVRILTDEDWEEFKRLFDGVHKGLLSRLLLKHHNLTLAEQRLFLLMKLAMSTKQIANILGVSPDTVKKGRYRLKKKLGLTESKTLQEFVDSF